MCEWGCVVLCVVCGWVRVCGIVSVDMVVKIWGCSLLNGVVCVSMYVVDM